MWSSILYCCFPLCPNVLQLLIKSAQQCRAGKCCHLLISPSQGVGRELKHTEMRSPTATPGAWGKNPDPVCVTSLPSCLWAPLSKALCPVPVFHWTGSGSLSAQLDEPISPHPSLPPTSGIEQQSLFFFFPRKGFSFSFSFFFSRKYLCFLELASTEQHHQGNSCVSASAWLFAWSILVLSPLFALHYS